MNRLFSSVFVAFSIAIPLSSGALAQEETPAPTRPAYLRPPADDANFSLMGEYVGEVSGSDGSSQVMGVQVRPIGGNQFEALSYAGGLPGQEGHVPGPTRLIGIRSGEFVVLSGGPNVLVVDPDQCLILDPRGGERGALERVFRLSPTLGASPPKEAQVLFDGRDTDQFTGGRMTDEGLLMEGADLRPLFQDFNLHLEFRLPYMPTLDGQARGNSGVYLQSRYECQILDSFAQTRQFNGCGSLYRFRKPDFNMCLPPLVWQSYDIQFTSPRWDSDGNKVRDAHATVWLNGVKVQDNVALPNKTGAGRPEGNNLLPIRLQNHSDPVRFRNIWIVDRGLATGDFPKYATPDEIPRDWELETSEKEPEDNTVDSSSKNAEPASSEEQPSGAAAIAVVADREVAASPATDEEPADVAADVPKVEPDKSE